MNSTQTTIDKRLDDALATSNYRITLANQLELAYLKMRETMIVPYNGGTFVADAPFLTYVCGRRNLGPNEIVVLDVNSRPIKVSDLDQFVQMLETAHAEALNTYYIYYERVRKARTTHNVIGA